MKYFRKEATFSGREMSEIYNALEIVIERENEFIKLMSEPNEYEEEDYSESIASAKKHIEELKALQNKLLTD